MVSPFSAVRKWTLSYLLTCLFLDVILIIQVVLFILKCIWHGQKLLAQNAGSTNIYKKVDSKQGASNIQDEATEDLIKFIHKLLQYVSNNPKYRAWRTLVFLWFLVSVIVFFLSWSLYGVWAKMAARHVLPQRETEKVHSFAKTLHGQRTVYVLSLCFRFPMLLFVNFFRSIALLRSNENLIDMVLFLTGLAACFVALVDVVYISILLSKLHYLS